MRSVMTSRGTAPRPVFFCSSLGPLEPLRGVPSVGAGAGPGTVEGPRWRRDGAGVEHAHGPAIPTRQDRSQAGGDDGRAGALADGDLGRRDEPRLAVVVVGVRRQIVEIEVFAW